MENNFYEEKCKILEKMVEQYKITLAFREDTSTYKKAVNVIDYLDSEIAQLNGG